MTHYRLYFLDDHGRIDSARDLQAPTEDAAYEHAELLSEGRDWELWRGSDVIAKLVHARRRTAPKIDGEIHPEAFVAEFRARSKEAFDLASRTDNPMLRDEFTKLAKACEEAADILGHYVM